MVCPHCGNDLIDTEMSVSEFCNILLYTDNNPKVVQALMELYKNDPIEYQIKLNQLKMQYEQQKTNKKRNIILKLQNLKNRNLLVLSADRQTL